MKTIILEPLGVDKKKLLSMAKEKLGASMEIIYYDTRAEDRKHWQREAKRATWWCCPISSTGKKLLSSAPN